MSVTADIKENDILKMSPDLLNTLLKDHTLSTEDKQVNIFWATDNYADRGKGFQYNDQITIETITGENGDVIVPRVEHRSGSLPTSVSITEDVFSTDSHLLEINSKSGLYPLYLVYNIYRSRIKNAMFSPESLEEHQAIWDTAIAENIFVICKTPMAKAITRRTLLGFRKGKTNMWAPDDLINKIKNQPELFIKKVHDLVGKDVKLKAIVGNPPYQVMDGGAGASAVPVYNLFIDVARKLKPDYFSMIMPSRWMTGGRGLDDFRKEMIDDHHIQTLYDYFDASICFDNVEIKGGICYFLWNKNYDGKCHIHTFINNEKYQSIRYLKAEENDDIFIRNPFLVGIKGKINNEHSFDTIVSSMKPYGLRGDFFASPAKYNLPSISLTKISGGHEIIGIDAKQKRVSRFVPSDYPFPQDRLLTSYKIFVPRNYGIGKIGEAPSDPVLAIPGQACTETFIEIGPFENPVEMANCKKYMDTKFFRCIVSIRKNGQGAGRNVYHYVPMQDFTENSDIDWTKSVSEIDQQLYKKYHLDENEVSFIETMIKPM